MTDDGPTDADKSGRFMGRSAITLATLWMVWTLGCGGDSKSGTTKAPAPNVTPTIDVTPPDVDAKRPPSIAPGSPDEYVPPRPAAVDKALSAKSALPAPTPQVTTNKPSAPATGAAKTAPPTAAGAVRLDLVDLAQFQQRISALKGKPVALDFWATWCAPCREKFPQFVELSNKHAGRAHFISVSFDEEDEHDEAAKFLADAKAQFTHWRLTDEVQRAQEKLQFEAVPRYFLYDADGKLIVNSDKIEKLKAALEALESHPPADKKPNS